MIRDARPAEMGEVGDIRIAAYRAGGFISEDSGYAPTLRGLGADGSGHVLVALDGADRGPGRGEAVVGTVMLQLWPLTGQVVTGPHEAEIRALAVRPHAQGRGIGRELLYRVMERAAELGIPQLVLCTEPEMRSAHHLYEQAGFARLPGRDWSPAPGVSLIVYGRPTGPAPDPGRQPVPGR
ncbi:MAG: GNAT family N-acetyltransferase [Streptosporangiaceae bacterium]